MRVSRSRVKRGRAGAGGLRGAGGCSVDHDRRGAALADRVRARRRTSASTALVSTSAPIIPAISRANAVDLGLVADARPPAAPLSRRASTRPSARSRSYLDDDVAEHEPVERDPPRHQLAHRRVALLDPHVARVEPVGLDGDVGLRDEVLVAAERLERRRLAGRVAVEGEDHLAAELLVVGHEPAQHLGVVVAERGAAGRHRGLHAGQVAGHHVGVALDDHGLRRARHLATGEVDAVEHLALLVDRGLGGVEVLRLDPVVVEDPPRAEADGVAAGLADRPQQPAAEPVVRRPTAPAGPRARPATSSSSREAARAQVLEERLALARREAEAEVLRRRRRRSRARSRNCRACDRVGGQQLLGVELLRDPVGLDQRCREPAPWAAPRAVALLALQLRRRTCPPAARRPRRS